MMNQIRSSGLWIINCNATVRSLISRCTKCSCLRGNLELQNMAYLAGDKMCEEPLYTHCDVDLFGSFVVKERHKELKQYGALFTCLSSRAIHIEAPNSLSTDCFIMYLQRFIDQRGNVIFIRSDNGTSFVGVSAELTKAFTLNHQKLNQFIQDNGRE